MSVDITSRFRVPLSLSKAGVDKAFIAEHRRLLLGDMNRRAYYEAAFDTPNLHLLPPLHLFDQRVRAPLLSSFSPPLSRTFGPSAPPSEVEIQVLLDQMLLASDRLGGRKLVAESLQLDPVNDARALANLGIHSPELLNRCMQGRLGHAIRIVRNASLAAHHRDEALDLISRLLIYFNCFSIQLVAARAWWLDHLPFRTGNGSGPYRTAALIGDLKELTDVVQHIAHYISGQRSRPPTRLLVQNLCSQAENWRKNVTAPNNMLLLDLKKFFSGIEPYLERLQKSLARAKTVSQLRYFTVHRAVLGVSAGEALAFASARLIQLRDNSSQMVRSCMQNKKYVPLPLKPELLPNINDPDRAKLLYALRVATLMDQSASTVNSDSSVSEFEDEEKSLVEFYSDYSGSDPLPAPDLRSRTAKLIRRQSNADPLDNPLAQREAFDVRPEWYLLVRKVPPAPPSPADLLQRKNQLDEQNRSKLPPNIRRASGKGTLRRKKPRS